MYSKSPLIALFLSLFVFGPISQVQAVIIDIDFNTPTTNITYNGDAFQDVGNGYAVLTPDNYWKTGGLWHNTPFYVDQFTSTFDFYVGNTTVGADGITFAVIDTTNGLNALGLDGGFLGYEGIGSSFAVEFDTFYNPFTVWPNIDDPNGNHIGIDQDGSVKSLIIDSTIPTLEDGTVHTAQIAFNSGNIKVYLDSVLRLDYNISGFPSVGYFGFSGGTGDRKNLQYVDNWTLNAEPIPEPGALCLFGLGLAGLGACRRIRKKK